MSTIVLYVGLKAYGAEITEYGDGRKPMEFEIFENENGEQIGRSLYNDFCFAFKARAYIDTVIFAAGARFHGDDIIQEKGFSIRPSETGAAVVEADDKLLLNGDAMIFLSDEETIMKIEAERVRGMVE